MEHKLDLQIIDCRDMETEHVQGFPAWHVNKAFEFWNEGSPIMSEELFALASRTMMTSLSYNGCVVKGVKFLTVNRDSNHKTRCSGVYVLGVDGDDFYGQLEEVIVMQYTFGSVILMCCRWFDTDARKKRKRVAHNVTSIYTNTTWYKDDHFILLMQEKQVFYTDDLLNGLAW